MSNGSARRIRTMVEAFTRLLAALASGIVDPSWRGLSLRRSLFRVRVASGLVMVVSLLARSLGLGSVALLVVATSALAIAPPEAVGSLYAASGQYLCTASVVDGGELGLVAERVVLTAGHCVEPYLVRGAAGAAWSSVERFVVGFSGEERFAVAPLRVGFSNSGFDLAVLGFTGKVPGLTPLRMGSWERIDFGTEIVNFANPLGLGIQYFTGSVTMLRIEPAGGGAERRWLLNAVAALQVGPGSSGSLILTASREYVGVLSGVVEARFGSPFTVFVPQWRIVAFLEDEDAGRDVHCACARGEPSAGLAGGLSAVPTR